MNVLHRYDRRTLTAVLVFTLAYGGLWLVLLTPAATMMQLGKAQGETLRVVSSAPASR